VISQETSPVLDCECGTEATLGCQDRRGGRRADSLGLLMRFDARQCSEVTGSGVL
jgi:hypothetical protein